MTAPNASRQSVAVSSRLYSRGRAGLALARAASRIGPEFATRPRLSCTGAGTAGPSRTVSNRAYRPPRPPGPHRRRPRRDRRLLRAPRNGARGLRRRPARPALRRAEDQPPPRRTADQSARPPPHARLGGRLPARRGLARRRRARARAGRGLLRARAGATDRRDRPDPLALPARSGRQPGRAVRAHLKPGDEVLERAPARLEVLELVEARARRREQDDLAGARGRAGGVQRALEVALVGGVLAEDVAQGGRRLADEIDAGAPGVDRRAQRREVLALAAAAEDQVDRRAGEARERHERRVDVRRLRVVHVEDAVDGRDLLQAVLDPGERAQPVADGVDVDAAREADRRRRHRVQAVVGAAQADLVGGEQRLVGPPELTGALGHPAFAIGPDAHAPRAPAEVLDAEPDRRDRDVVVALVREDLQLGGAVGLEGA